MPSTESPAVPILATESLPSITAEQAKSIFAQGEAAVVFALLELAKQLAEARSPAINPATPSAMVPTYLKLASKKRMQPVGAKPGHPGSRRE